jgi:hypothetical protein
MRALCGGAGTSLVSGVGPPHWHGILVQRPDLQNAVAPPPFALGACTGSPLWMWSMVASHPARSQHYTYEPLMMACLVVPPSVITMTITAHHRRQSAPWVESAVAVYRRGCGTAASVVCLSVCLCVCVSVCLCVCLSVCLYG